MFIINHTEAKRLYRTAFNNAGSCSYGSRTVLQEAPALKVLLHGNSNKNPILRNLTIFMNNLEKFQNEIKKLFLNEKDQAVQALLNIIRVFDPKTAKHCERVAKTAAGFGKFLGMNPQQVKELETAGLLHDIGKLGVSLKILNKKGNLSPQERREVKKHAHFGRVVLDLLGFSKINQFFRNVSKLVESHHNYSGKLVGEQVQALRLSDVYEARRERRSYNKPLSIEEAFIEMKKQMKKEKNIWSPSKLEEFKTFILLGQK